MIVVGIVDYGIGNQASVRHALTDIGFRVHVSADPEVLAKSDVFVLPGVGAFPAAMQALEHRGLAGFVRQRAAEGAPLLGICLGMQLLATRSFEYQLTPGLGLIDGEVVPLAGAKWHIGWNSLRCWDDPLIAPSNGATFYFNHSFMFRCSPKHQVATASHFGDVPAVVRRGKIVGLQFHPEKSQQAGRVLLRNIITGLHYA